MIKNKLIYCLFILALLLPAKIITGQSIPELERKLIQLQNSFERQSQLLDSTKNILNEKAAQIDNEKKKKNPDRDKIVNLMSHSVSISNQIDNQQKILSELESQIEVIKKALNNKYSFAIDSLNQLKSRRRSGQEEIQAQILLLTEKKLLTAPKVSALSLNPDKLLKMDLNQAKNDREEKLYREYLQSALNELDGQIKRISESCSEAEEIVYLQKKAGKFLEESEFQSEIRPRRSRELTAEGTSSNSYTDPAMVKDASRFTNIYLYTALLIQLQAVTSPYIKPLWLKTGEVRDKNLSMSEYYELLKEVKKNLLEYRGILLHKLGGK